MDFESSCPLEGEGSRVLDLALHVLVSNGFKLVRQDGDTIEFEGDGMHSTKQSPVLGASRIRIAVDGRQARLSAMFGGVRRMQRMMIFLPLGLGIFLTVLFLALFHEMGIGLVLLISLAPVAPWLVLTPLLNRWIRRRTEAALDTLLSNLVLAAAGKARPHA